jgi:2-oxoglutarate ferredoxin oxidoreductase subunit gamma
MQKEIRICGFGGQGIVLAGLVLGEAAIKAGYWAVQTQSYGPEARGGAARSEVVISSEPVDYPRVQAADVLVALSQPGYDKFGRGLAKSGIVVVEQDLVAAEGARTVPFTRTAEKLGHKIVGNIVMLGYIGALLDLFSPEVLTEAVMRNVPAGTEDLNRRAVLAGRELFGAGARS